MQPSFVNYVKSFHSEDLKGTSKEGIHFPDFIPLNELFTSKKISNFDEHQMINPNETNGLRTEVYQNEKSKVIDEKKKELGIKDTTEHLIPIDSFGKENDRILNNLTISVEHLPVELLTSSLIIESLLDYAIELLNNCDVHTSSGTALIMPSPIYSWAYVDGEHGVTSRTIYIRFKDILTLDLFSKLLRKNNSLTIIHKPELDISLHKLTDQITVNVNKLNESGKSIAERLNQLVKMVSAQAVDPIITKGNDKSYKIDPTSIVDVRPDLIDGAKREIIQFRVGSAAHEEERKKQRVVKDNQETMKNIQELLCDINEIRKVSSHESSDHSKIESAVNKCKSDEDIEKERSLHLKEVNDRNYHLRLQLLKREEIQRLTKYDQYVTKIKHDIYLKKVIPERHRAFMKSFVDSIHDSDNIIDKSFNYYVNHSNYLKFRQPQKEREEKADDDDRKNDRLQDDAESKAESFINSFSEKRSTKRKMKIKINSNKRRKE